MTLLQCRPSRGCQWWHDTPPLRPPQPAPAASPPSPRIVVVVAAVVVVVSGRQCWPAGCLRLCQNRQPPEEHRAPDNGQTCHLAQFVSHTMCRKSVQRDKTKCTVPRQNTEIAACCRLVAAHCPLAAPCEFRRAWLCCGLVAGVADLTVGLLAAAAQAVAWQLERRGEERRRGGGEERRRRRGGQSIRANGSDAATAARCTSMSATAIVPITPWRVASRGI